MVCRTGELTTDACGRRCSMHVRENGRCFACGFNNPIGLKLAFRECEGGIETTFVPTVDHQGFAGIVHGGLVGLVLDEAMAKLLYIRSIEALTCEITIRLRKIARIGQPLTVRATLLGERRRLLELEAFARNPKGEIIATARAKFLRVGK